MLKRDRKRSINVNSLLFNGAGLLIGLIVVGYTAGTYLSKDETPPCTPRYPRPAMLGLEGPGGTPLSPIELQARAGMREWGVLENVKVVKAEGAPTKTVMEVKLARATNASAPDAAAGIGMSWLPAGLTGAQSACMSYSVQLADDFDFTTGGQLPGLYGGVVPGAANVTSGFLARMSWTGSGLGLVNAQGADGQPVVVSEGFNLSKGRWMHIEQEVVLNEPKQANGVYRLWIDGRLKAEAGNVVWRTADETKITGIVNDVSSKPGPVQSRLRLSPPVVGWK